MPEEELFEKYVKEELERETLDPLEYIYYRDSAGFASYMLRARGRELLEEIMRPFEPFLQWLEEKLEKIL